MSAARPLEEISQSALLPCLLVELPSWPRVFFGNLRDLIFPRSLPPLDLRSPPAPFWADVFVERGLPWARFLQSVAYHGIALALLIAIAVVVFGRLSKRLVFDFRATVLSVILAILAVIYLYWKSRPA